MNDLTRNPSPSPKQRSKGGTTLLELMIASIFIVGMIAAVIAAGRSLHPYAGEEIERGDVVPMPLLSGATVTEVDADRDIFVVEATDAEGRTHVFPLSREAIYHLRNKEDRR